MKLELFAVLLAGVLIGMFFTARYYEGKFGAFYETQTIVENSVGGLYET